MASVRRCRDPPFGLSILFVIDLLNSFRDHSSLSVAASWPRGILSRGILVYHFNKTLAAFLKILHPGCSPTDEEFDEYTAYAVEARRRVKEQMHKRKPDGEFAKFNLTFVNA